MMCEKVVVQKQTHGGIYNKSDFFVRRHGDTLNLSAAVRDSILPCQFVDVFVSGADLILHPTENEASYKVAEGGHGQRKICCCKLRGFIEIAEGVRHYATILDNGDVVIHCGGVAP